MVMDGERQLKDAIDRERETLLQLLQGPVEQAWEDGLYRFYHQSHKVFRLQKLTQEIVAKLQALLPHRPLNTWFQEIIAAGTTLQFTMDTNQRWTETTRPIVEAFCHAKYFLAMACKVHEEFEAAIPGDGEETRSIRMVDSGWSALLALFNID